jgi:hypothetical protein
MRRWPIAAAVAGLALALAGTALAYTFTQHGSVTLTNAFQAGQSAGISASLYSTTSPSVKPPWSAQKVTITLPPGTTFSLARFKACTLTDGQIESGKACPSASKIGSGSADAFGIINGKTVGPFPGAVSAYVRSPTRMILIVKATLGSATKTVVINETTSRNVLSITVPQLKVPFGGMKVPVVLSKLTLTVPKKGTGSSALIKAGRCTNSQWLVKTHFVYTNGKTWDLTSREGFCS